MRRHGIEAPGKDYISVHDLAAAKRRMIKMRSKTMKRIKSKRKRTSRILQLEEASALLSVQSLS
jgi:hypothetical protein